LEWKMLLCLHGHTLYFVAILVYFSPFWYVLPN
jgi:hypothetical protein